MKKKLFFIILAIIMPIMVLITTLTMTGCSYETSPKDALEYGHFKVIKERVTTNTVYCEVYDVNTKVIYVYLKIGYSGSFTMLVNADGSPMIYEGEL